MFRNRFFTIHNLFPMGAALIAATSLVVALAVALGKPLVSLGVSQGMHEPLSDVEAGALTRVQAAEAARLTGLAGQSVNLYGSTAWTVARGLTRAQAAEAARLTGLAGQDVNLYGSTAWVVATPYPLTRAQAAEAARYTALAISLGYGPQQISEQVSELIGP